MNKDAISSMQRLLCDRPVSVAWSGGKDSSVVLNLTMQAAKAVLESGQTIAAPILVTHGDTGIENPEIRAYASTEIGRLRRYAERHRIPLAVHVATPNLTESWPLRVIGGRALPSFPGMNHDCTTDLKIHPMQRLRKRLQNPKTAASLVTIIGTRFEESPQRAARMLEREETADKPWLGDDNQWYLSPIAYWTMEEVWEYLGQCRDGNPDVLTFSRFEEVFRIYADAAGSSCAVVGDMATKGQAKPCGARTGCAVCTPIGRDKSLEAMIEADPRYHYLLGLNQLQRFLLNTRWDFTRRNWMGRSVDAEGYITIAPDVYSPDMLRDLLRYVLTIDAVEAETARAEGHAPRFQWIDPKILLAIDAQWSLYGYHPAFEALRIFHDVHDLGRRYPVPDVDAWPQQPMPRKQRLYVGTPWEDQQDLQGYRDIQQEIAVGSDSPCMGTRRLANGHVVMDVESSVAFDFDDEGVADFFGLEYDAILEDLQDGRDFGCCGSYLYYSRMGMLSVAPQAIATIDKIMRRTQWLYAKGWNGQRQVEFLPHRSIRPEKDGMTGPLPLHESFLEHHLDTGQKQQELVA
ncbi:conserved domain protein [Acidithiobacillus ferrooxidans ATCC 23270]|uniref:Conserved domain protein n=2 Tax=Acidithiobacillaceae TaxID=225058 RepID=B7J801_ACIF2|nr:conserved domain protein [Acidithiobacillus ferrooxidans ATCC 23270]